MVDADRLDTFSDRKTNRQNVVILWRMEDLWVVLLAEICFEYPSGWCSAGIIIREGMETRQMHRRWLSYRDYSQRNYYARLRARGKR